jgi:hypothetical protein
MATKKFFKEINITGSHSAYNTNIKVYIFKVWSDSTPSKKTADWMSAFRDRNGTDFIVESGAGISEKKMESQIKSYLKKQIKSKGWI